MTKSACLLGLLCLLVPVFAMGDEITVQPSSIYVFTVEEFITIRGTNLLGNVATEVVFSGRTGTFTIPPNIDENHTDATTLPVWLPFDVSNTVGTWTVTVRSIDDNGVRTHGPASFHVIERPLEGPPLLQLPEAIYAEAINKSGAAVSFSVSGTSLNGQPAIVTCDRQIGSLFPIGTTIVTCIAIDNFGSTSGSFPIIVGDTTPPVLTIPNNITSSNPVVTYTVSAVDNLGGEVVIECHPPSGSEFPVGMTTVVTCTATDDHLNPTTAQFNVKILSATPPPVLTLPADIVAEATGPNGAVVNYVATSDSGTISCNPPSGSTFALGLTTVQCSATNDGGTTTGSFNVTVRDTTAPTLTLPANMLVEATSIAGAVVTFTATASDLVDGSRPVTCNPASGSTFGFGPTTVNCSASDTRGNTRTGSFTVTVQDTTRPRIVSITANPATIWPPNHKMVLVELTVVATDLPGSTPVSTIFEVQSDQPLNTTADGNTEEDWALVGPLTVELRAERTGNIDRTYTIIIDTVDAAGNVTRSTHTVKVTQGRARAAR